MCAASVLLALTAAGCSRPEPPVPTGWNVLFVLVDTLRADRLGLYGYERATSPYLEQFARRAVVFENARSQAACTFPSANSLLTSRYPHHFLAEGRAKKMAIPEDIPALPEMLSAAGYATAAVSASPIVRHNPSRFNRHGGFGRGFDRFDESCLARSAACVNQRAFEALEELAEPFLLYLHYMEPHGTYRPPATHRRRFAVGYDGKRWVRDGELRPLKDMLYRGGPRVAFTDRDIAHLRDLYDEEILYFDGRFRQLVDHLAGRGVLERTLVVLASDHGEELMDHGHVGHCRNLAYESVLRTPLVMKIPSLLEGRVRKALVQNLDVVPTVLDYLGLLDGTAGLEGHSLRPVIETDQPLRSYQFAGQGTRRVATDGRFKLIRNLATGADRLFFLPADPGERVALSAVHPALAAHRSALDQWMAAFGDDGPPEDRLRRARAVEAELRAVGYL